MIEMMLLSCWNRRWNFIKEMFVIFFWKLNLYSAKCDVWRAKGVAQQDCERGAARPLLTDSCAGQRNDCSSSWHFIFGEECYHLIEGSYVTVCIKLISQGGQYTLSLLYCQTIRSFISSLYQDLSLGPSVSACPLLWDFPCWIQRDKTCRLLAYARTLQNVLEYISSSSFKLKTMFFSEG